MTAAPEKPQKVRRPRPSPQDVFATLLDEPDGMQAASGACIMALRPWLSADSHTLIGMAVRLVGLQATPELNGRVGTAVAFGAAEGRYRVLLLGAGAITVSHGSTVATACARIYHRGILAAVRARNLEPAGNHRISDAGVAALRASLQSDVFFVQI